MKKLFTLFLLLVLAMFSYAQETVYTYDFEDGINPFTDDSRITSGIEYNATADGNVLGWTCAGNAQNGYSFSHFDFTSLLDKPETVKIEFDYYNTAGGRSVLVIGDASVRGTTGGSSKYKYNLTGAIFYIGSNKDKSFIGEEYFPLESQVGELGVEEGLSGRWLHVAVTVNTENRTVAWTVADATGPELSSGSAAYYSDDAIDCTQIDVFGCLNNSHCCMMDNLTITNYKSNAQYADYTVRYVDEGGNELKPSRSGNGKVGGHATLLPSDKKPFYSEDGTKKYFYVSDNSDSEVIAEQGTLISVLFREAETWYAVLDCVTDEDVSLAQLTGTFLEGDELTLYPSRGHEYAGAYYMTPAPYYNGAAFTFPGFLQPVQEGGKTCFKGKQVYTKDANVAYYSEFERLALPQTDEGHGTGLGQLFGTVNSWYSFSGSYFDRFSGGRGIRLNAESYVWTEPVSEAGTYRVTIYGRNDVSADATEPYRLGLRDAEGNVTYFVGLTIPSWNSAATGHSIVEDVVIPQGYSLVVMNPSESNKISLDDITLTAIVPSVCYTEFDEATGTLTYYYDNQMSSRSGITEVYDPVGHPGAQRFVSYHEKVLKAVIDPSMKDAPLTLMRWMFYGFHDENWKDHNLSNMTTIEGLKNLNTANVTSMHGMFYRCESLTSLDLSSFNTDKVTDMNTMFHYCKSLTSLDLSSFKTDNVTDMNRMFNNCQSLTSLDLSSFNTANVTDMTYMFSSCKSLTSLDLSKFNTANVTDIFGMFCKCSNLTSLDLTSFNTANVTEMAFMFSGCSALTSLDLSSFNTTKVTGMYNMFEECSNLTSLDLTSFNTANVTEMELMFSGCSALTSLDLSSFNTEKVTDMTEMFMGCSALTSLDLSSFNIEKVTDMTEMFMGCSALTSLDLSSFNIEKVEYASEMFSCCSNLTTIFCNSDWSTSSELDSNDMFYGCTALVGGKGTAYDSNFTDATYARPDGGTGAPGYFTEKILAVYTEFVEATGTLTYYYDEQMPFRSGVTERYDPVNQPLHFNNYYNKIVKVVIDPSMSDASLTSMKNMFYGGLCTSPVRFQSLSALMSIEGLEYLNTKDVTDMTGMFTMCQSLTKLDLSSFNTSNVTTMNAMFSNCSSLQQVDVSSFDVTGVTDFGYMFSGCSKLTTILCSSDWSTGNAKSGSMFADCTALVGGMGTTFDASHRDKTYARPDGGTESPGYFTAVLVEGDLNGDGKVDIADAVAVLEVMAKDDNDPEADLNGDGKVDIADFVAVLEIMAKQ